MPAALQQLPMLSQIASAMRPGNSSACPSLPVDEPAHADVSVPPASAIAATLARFKLVRMSRLATVTQRRCRGIVPPCIVRADATSEPTHDKAFLRSFAIRACSRATLFISRDASRPPLSSSGTSSAAGWPLQPPRCARVRSPQKLGEHAACEREAGDCDADPDQEQERRHDLYEKRLRESGERAQEQRDVTPLSVDDIGERRARVGEENAEQQV